MEKEIELEQEAIVVYSGGGAVNSVNGYTGDVVLTTSDLENTSDYQTGTEVESAISTAIAGKQDALTAGNNITISNNTISATDTTYSAGTGLTLDGTQFSVDTSTIATQQDVSNEATARENADTNLQGQIDAISAASDVTDIVGTYAALQAYDTTHLKDNDIIKVLQDESQNDETTYYRWSTSTQTFTLIGEEGPYYTKSQTDTLLQAKQNTLTAGSNVQIVNDTISATDTTYTAGTGLALNGTQFSVDTTTIATQSDLTAGLATKQDTLTAGANVQINNNTISATDTTYTHFTGATASTDGVQGLVPGPLAGDEDKFLKADGTWDTVGSSVNVVQAPGTSTTDVMSQNATTSMVYADPLYRQRVQIGNSSNASGANSISIGVSPNATSRNAVAIGSSATAAHDESIALGFGATTSAAGEMNIGAGSSGRGYNSSNYRLLSGLYDGQSAHDAATKGQLDSAVTGIELELDSKQDVLTAGDNITIQDESGDLVISATDTTYTAGTGINISNGVISATSTGPTVVQTTGTSTTDVMSQNAVTSMIFADPANKTRVRIGNANTTANGKGAVAIGQGAGTAGGNDGENVAIGYFARATKPDSTAIGGEATASSAMSIAIGRDAMVTSTGSYSVVFGLGQADTQGVFQIGLNRYANSTFGYNNSPYRLLSGVYDGQSDHDAATVGQITPLTDSTAPTTATVGTLGKIYIDTSTATAYMCVEADDVTPSYTWKQITA